VHEINRHAVDFGLPAPIAFSRPVKPVEGNLADEANDARFADPNDFQRAPDASLCLPFLQHSHIRSGTIHQIDEIQSVFRQEFPFIYLLE
jgi:hypothetical protein